MSHPSTPIQSVRRWPGAIEIGRRIRELRRQRQLSQTELGQLLAVPQTYISRYEQGGNLSLPTLCRLADFFGVSLDWLVRGTPTPSQDAA